VILAHRLMKNSIGVSEYMLFTESFSKIQSLNNLSNIEQRKEKCDGLGSIDCSVFYPDPNLYELEVAKKKSWLGNNWALLKYFIQSKSKKNIEKKYNLMSSF
tara:strand:+ start:266 stop:571 length:306 start_codon:yes stop_codon:yes gene_type:complete